MSDSLRIDRRHADLPYMERSKQQSGRRKKSPVKQEVVINNCYGGFGVSERAIEKLYELGAVGIKTYLPEVYFGAGWEKKVAEAQAGDKWFSRRNIIDGKVITFDSDGYRSEVRSDPKLVQVVRELGAEANGNFANLIIVPIPAGVKFRVEEYDGNEWVAENHRTWGGGSNDDDDEG